MNTVTCSAVYEIFLKPIALLERMLKTHIKDTHETVMTTNMKYETHMKNTHEKQ